MKLFVTVAIGIYYISYSIYYYGKEKDKSSAIEMSIALLISYIIFLLLIWKVV